MNQNYGRSIRVFMASFWLGLQTPNLLGEKHHDSDSRNVQEEHCEDDQSDSRVLGQGQ